MSSCHLVSSIDSLFGLLIETLFNEICFVISILFDLFSKSFREFLYRVIEFVDCFKKYISVFVPVFPPLLKCPKTVGLTSKFQF